MDVNHDLVTIVLPVYNAELYIEETIKSVLKQSYRNFELIIIDDASSDRSYHICKALCSQDKRVALYRNEKNQGLCKSRNLGIEYAKGKYITFIDHDDLITENLLYENICILKHTNAEWVKFGHIDYMYQGTICLKKKVFKFKKALYSKENLYEHLLQMQLKEMFTYVWDAIFELSIIRKNQIRFDENFKYGNEDIDFCLEYCMHCRNLAVNDHSFYSHYMRIGVSTSSQFAEEKLMSYCYLGKKINQKYSSMEISIQKYGTLYHLLMCKLILFNLCQDLNRDSCTLAFAEKKKMLKDLLDQSALNNSFNVNWHQIFKESFKMFCYFFLYKIRFYGLLLLFDKYTRKIVYFFRKNANRRVDKRNKSEWKIRKAWN